LSVCPHVTAKHIAGWFVLNSYLQRNLNISIRFEPNDNFIEERNRVLNGGYSIVYANPFSAAVFIHKLGFVPVAKPVGVFDETILVGGLDQGIPARRPLRVASAADKLITHALGLSLLQAQNISSSDCEFQFVGSHLKAAQAVIEGRADLAFVFNETWNSLSESTRQPLAVIGQTSSKGAFHCFCIAPDLADRLEQVQTILCNMQNDAQGKKVLEDIHYAAGFEPMQQNDLAGLVDQLKKMGFLD
jgi:phosphonate transport system substrate-binding protein